MRLGTRHKSLVTDVAKGLAISLVLPFALLAAGALLTGCATPMTKLDNSARLVARPDFEAARQAAPEWCRDALKTINQLEFQLEAK